MQLNVRRRRSCAHLLCWADCLIEYDAVCGEWGVVGHELPTRNTRPERHDHAGYRYRLQPVSPSAVHHSPQTSLREAPSPPPPYFPPFWAERKMEKEEGKDAQTVVAPGGGVWGSRTGFWD